MLNNGFYVVYDIYNGNVISFHNEELERVTETTTKVSYTSDYCDYIEVIDDPKSLEAYQKETYLHKVNLTTKELTRKSDAVLLEHYKKHYTHLIKEIYLKDIKWIDAEWDTQSRKKAVGKNSPKNDLEFTDIKAYWEEANDQYKAKKLEITDATTLSKVYAGIDTAKGFENSLDAIVFIHVKSKEDILI